MTVLGEAASDLTSAMRKPVYFFDFLNGKIHAEIKVGNR
jgi:hypothetical protein